MNSLKSIFVTPFMTLMSVLGIWSVVSLASQGFSFGWMGTAIVTLPFLAFLGGALTLQAIARTSARLPSILVLTLVGTVIALYGLSVGEPAGPVIAALAAATGFFLYNFWYSDFGRTPSAALAVGKPLPAFELEDETGKTIRSADYVGAPAIFLFFRGNWCPLCVAQIKEIAGEYSQLASMGAKVCLISPQSHAQTQKLAARFDVPFDFLVDVDNKAAKALNIDHIAGLPKGMEALGYDSDTVMPTLLVTDSSGTIIFADQTDNYRVRPEPETFLRVLREAGATA